MRGIADVHGVLVDAGPIQKTAVAMEVVSFVYPSLKISNMDKVIKEESLSLVVSMTKYSQQLQPRVTTNMHLLLNNSVATFSSALRSTSDAAVDDFNPDIHATAIAGCLATTSKCVSASIYYDCIYPKSFIV